MALLCGASACDRTTVALDDGASHAEAYRLHTETEQTADGVFLRVEVEPVPPYKVNLEFPWALGVPAIDVEHRADAAHRLDEDRAVFRVPAGAAAGTVEGRLRLSVCTDDICLTPRETVRWDVASAQ